MHAFDEHAHDRGVLLQVKELADEVVAHMRTVVGTDAFLAAYNKARQHVTGLRRERKRQMTLQVNLNLYPCVLPSADLPSYAMYCSGIPEGHVCIV